MFNKFYFKDLKWREFMLKIWEIQGVGLIYLNSCRKSQNLVKFVLLISFPKWSETLIKTVKITSTYNL